MLKHVQRNFFSRSIFILFLFFCMASWSMIKPAYAGQISVKPDAQVLVEGTTNKKAVSRIVESIVDKQERILAAITAEKTHIQETIKQGVSNLSSVKQSVYHDFVDLYIIYTSNKNEPAELALLDEQLRRFIFQLTELYTPLKDMQQQVHFRLEQLKNLIESLEFMSDAPLRDSVLRAKDLQKVYSAFENTLDTSLQPTALLLQKLHKTSLELEEKMPKLWLQHYIYKKVSLFDAALWTDHTTLLSSIPGSVQNIMLSELPNSIKTWFTFAVNVFFMGGICTLMLFALYKASAALPKVFQDVWQQISKESLPYIFLGATLEYASWYGGNRYQVISAVGMLCLCYGQIRMAWIFWCVKWPECVSKSPFLPLVFFLGVSFVLLTFIDFASLLAALWFIFLISFLFFMRKAVPLSVPLLRYLRLGFYAMLVLGAFLTLEGHVYLSFFIILLYICLMMGIHQVQTWFRITSMIDTYLPKNGISALLSGLVLALAIPILLVIALLSPFAWALTFPGGEYLLKILSNFDVSIGKVSFNAMQALSIIIIFYLVKSTITISCNYIDTTWSFNGSTSKSSIATLTTPIKTSIFFGLWGLFGLYVLKVVGFSLTSLTVIAGGLSVGVGLGMQGIVQNTFSGFLLIFGQNIREGDVVVVGTVRGIVQKVSLRATKVRTFDNAIVFVPNSEFLATSFINWTHNDRVMRNIISVGVAYGSDMALVRKVIHTVLEENERVLQRPAPHVRFMNFGNSSLDLEIRFWIANYIQHIEICSEVRYALDAAFRAHNIEVPFLQADITIKGAWPDEAKTADRGVAHNDASQAKPFDVKDVCDNCSDLDVLQVQGDAQRKFHTKRESHEVKVSAGDAQQVSKEKEKPKV